MHEHGKDIGRGRGRRRDKDDVRARRGRRRKGWMNISYIHTYVRKDERERLRGNRRGKSSFHNV